MSPKLMALIMLSICTGFLIGYIYFYLKPTSQTSATSECPEKYSFLNDQLDCNVRKVISKKEYSELEVELEKYIEEQQEKDYVNHISIYFRDLVQGPTFGINEKEKFIAASLLKVPMLITYYSLEKDNSRVSQKKLSYTSFVSLVDQSEEKITPILAMREYTVDELIEHMTRDSDNISSTLLDKNLKDSYNTDVYNQTLIDLGLVSPRSSIDNAFSVKSYAAIFRKIYNASYLNSGYSDKALKLLSETSFKEGIIAGLPKGIMVSHKFGERGGLPDGNRQLHDC